MPPFKFRRIGIDQISETILASAWPTTCRRPADPWVSTG